MELFAADGHDAGGCERVTGKSGMRPPIVPMPAMKPTANTLRAFSVSLIIGAARTVAAPRREHVTVIGSGSVAAQWRTAQSHGSPTSSARPASGQRHPASGFGLTRSSPVRRTDMSERFTASNPFSSCPSARICAIDASRTSPICARSSSEGRATGRRPTIELFRFNIVCPTACSLSQRAENGHSTQCRRKPDIAKFFGRNLKHPVPHISIPLRLA